MRTKNRSDVVLKARKAVDALRDHAREHGMHFRERDPLVMDIHAIIDIAEQEAVALAPRDEKKDDLSRIEGEVLSPAAGSPRKP